MSVRRTESEVSQELAGLAALDHDSLRRRWRRLTSRPAPEYLPRHLLVRLIACRIQADAFGDLDGQNIKLLRELAKKGANGGGVPTLESLNLSSGGLRSLAPGTVIGREHGGTMHHVIVLANGFAWNGTTYRSLSELAYRYYVSAALLQGNKADAGSVRRVAAQDIEDRVVAALRSRGHIDESATDHRVAIHSTVDRITLAPTEITVTIRAVTGENGSPDAIQLSWTPPNHRRRRSMTGPTGGREPSVPPSRSVIRAEARARLLTAIATGRAWLNQLIQGDVADISTIANREGRTERSVRMIVSLAFLAPDIVKAAIAGTLPRGLGVSDMTDLPMDWAEQRKHLGLYRSED